MSQTLVFNNPFFEREEIFKNTKNISGCYIWLNRKNSKCYVGSSINLASRLKFYYAYNTHKLNYSSLIISALLNHGMGNFSLIIITLPGNNAKEVIKFEQFLIDYYNSDYNILRKADSRSGHKYSPESKRLMSQSNIRHSSPDSLLLGNGFINVYSPDKVLLNQYPSAKEAGRELNISDVSIFKYIRTGRLFKNMYYFSMGPLDENMANKINEKAYSKSTKPVRIYIYDTNRSLLYEFDSVSDSARKLEIPRTTISTYLDTQKVYKDLYIFSTYPLT